MAQPVPGGSELSAAARRLAGIADRLGLRVATAESCTGGLVAKAITDLPGASEYFAGGMIAYANDIKVTGLGVDPASLDTCGAVSREVALQMADGARRRFAADVAMAITGVAGPGGGAPDKPVGTVWLAVALPDGSSQARVERFSGGRGAVRDASAAAILEMAADAVLKPAADAARGATYGPAAAD